MFRHHRHISTAVALVVALAAAPSAASARPFQPIAPASHQSDPGGARSQSARTRSGESRRPRDPGPSGSSRPPTRRARRPRRPRNPEPPAAPDRHRLPAQRLRLGRRRDRRRSHTRTDPNPPRLNALPNPPAHRSCQPATLIEDQPGPGHTHGAGAHSGPDPGARPHARALTAPPPTVTGPPNPCTTVRTAPGRVSQGASHPTRAPDVCEQAHLHRHSARHRATRGRSQPPISSRPSTPAAHDCSALCDVTHRTIELATEGCSAVACPGDSYATDAVPRSGRPGRVQQWFGGRCGRTRVALVSGCGGR